MTAAAQWPRRGGRSAASRPRPDLEALTGLRALAQDHTLTLLTASKAADISEATVLAEMLR